MNKKIAIIGTVGVPANYGGFETLVEYLIKNLTQDFDITVFCSGKNYEQKLESYSGAKLKYVNLNANGSQSIAYDVVSLFQALKFADTVLILGVSGCVILPFVKLFSSKRIIVNIDGLEWKRHKWKRYVKWFLRFSEKVAVKYADIVIADNKVIQEHIDVCYDKKSTLIPYGSDHVKQLSLQKQTLEEYPFLSDGYAFTVCRIEPENNIEMMLKVFKKQKEMNYVIVGNWGRSSYGKELKGLYSECNNIHILNAIYDQNKLNQLRSNCRVYIHGHSAGGTNPSLVEAMYLNLPIFAYDIPYNIETTHYQAKYFKDEESLAFLLNNIEERDLSGVAKNMKQIADNYYCWDEIAKKYADLF